MRRAILFSIIIIAVILSLYGHSTAQGIPKISIELDQSDQPEDLSVALQILILLTVLSLAPAIVILLTSFIRLIIVFSFLRQAVGTHQMPPNQLLIGLALILTAFIMAPAIEQINKEAVQPYLAGEMNQIQAYETGIKPLRDFMLRQTREKDLALFVSMANIPQPESHEDLPTHIIIPGFVISEMRIAFQIGFLLYIPFLVIDMVVASVLMSMGMLMLPPIMVSLPFKILLFVLVDGWYLIVKSVVMGFH
ncbi:MAG: flagellar type III secretion system pore protein FliP [Candidatus Zixiibacteriota bacterium]|nr:MAG: flagellar type III secretion system pore protein FliP [candidate division Zixibacteria bacterium]